MNITFRLDSGNISQIGSGHLYRALKLAKIIKKNAYKRAKIYFAISNLTKKYERKIIKKNKFKIINVPKKNLDIKKEVKDISFNKPKIIIFDQLNTNKKLIISLKKTGAKIISFDDLGSGSKYTDLTINSLVKKTKYRNCYYGYDYLIFNKIKKIKVKKNIKNIFLFFGRYDQKKLTLKFINFIKKLNNNFTFHIVVFNKIKLKNKKNIKIYYKPINFNKILQKSDMAITSGGLTMIESLNAGIPTIASVQFLHQKRNIEILSKHKILKSHLPQSFFSERKFIEVFKSLCKNFNERKRLSYQSKKNINNLGEKKILKLIRKI